MRVALGLAVAIGIVVVILATAQIGPAGDARIANPDPQGTELVDGVPRNAEPFLGVEVWPMVFSIGFLVAATLFLAPFVWRSWRKRKLEYALVIFAGTAVLAWLDPPSNWVTFTVYNPELLHFPTTWPWMRLSPSVEPLLVIPGYPFYYFLIAFFAVGGYQRFVFPRVKPTSFWRRHPRWGMFTFGFAIGLIWDLPSELFMIRAGMYFYSQSFGPVLRWGGTHTGLPIIWTTFTAFSVAMISTVMWRDDTGESLVTSLARRFHRRSRRERVAGAPVSTGRQIIAASLLLSIAYLVPTGIFGVFRVTGLSNTPYYGEGYPYPDLKTYDPYGTLQDAGKPGPYGGR